MAYIIQQDICSCCHACDLTCPVNAIHMKNRKYWIDPDQCISCGKCAQRCHNRAISDPNRPKTATPAHEKIVKQCDVLVIGGGGSGLVAAAKAQSMGKSVILLEKNWETGGSAFFGHMMAAYYSKWHEAAGARDPRGQLFQEFTEKVGDRVNLKLVKRCLDANSQLLDWLIDCGELEKGFVLGPGRFGMEYDLIDSFEYDLNPLRSDPSIGPGASGWFICKLLTEKFVRDGGELLYSTQAKHLLTNNGRVVGALAVDAGGEIEVRAKATIVSAGTFTRSKEIMDKMQPLFYEDFKEKPIHIYACATCTGDGITMCDEIGADIDYKNRKVCMFGPVHHPYSFSVMNLELYSTRSELLITRDGAYIDPAGKMNMSEIGLLIDKPGRMAWGILDQRCMDEAIAFGESASDPDTIMSMRHWQRDLTRELQDGSVIRADTLEELAGKLGCSFEVLSASMATHNQLMEKSTADENSPENVEDNPLLMMLGEFPKAHALHAPYYAVFLDMFHENAMGGVTINEKTEVLKNGIPVPGLYATGDNTRGFMLPGKIAVDYIEMVLSAMTYAMCSGYIAALEAVDYTD